jgi:8-amino-7-oxononanoate synthase
MQGPPGPETVIDGRSVLYFGGTGYFGLQGHPEVLRAGAEAFRLGTHSATTRAGFGNNPVLLDLERKLAAYFGAEDAVVYPSGYMSGLFLAGAAGPSWDAAFLDEHAHFSLRDGVRAAGRPVISYRHRDPPDLEAKLAAHLPPGGRPLVLTDGVFPTYGLIAPLPALLAAVRCCGGVLAVDDSHGAGVLGSNGRGTLEHFGLVPGPDLIAAGTLSKAFGGHGGFLALSAALAERVRGDVSAYVGSTPTPTPMAAASAKGLELLAAHPEWRDALRTNTSRLKSGLRAMGLAVDDSPVPIAAWSLSPAAEMARVQAILSERGIALPRLSYAGAPDGGVLRATVFSTHKISHIDRLLEELKRIL